MGAHAHGAQLAFPAFSKPYASRRPEETILYRVVARNLRTFQAISEAENKRLAKHVNEEFESYLRCGVLAYGFLRLKCEGCKSERLVAFSCKKRGFCSSCGGRRMAETAAHLVDAVFPKVGVRQWVLSFPFPIRFILARNPKIKSQLLTIVHRAIDRHTKNKAKQKGFKSPLQTGSVTLIQRFGGSVNLNTHFHMLVLEGGYRNTFAGPRFWWVDPPTDDEIKQMVTTIAYRVMRALKRKGYFANDGEWSSPDDESLQEELIPEIQAASIRSKIAMGERKGQWVRRLGNVKFDNTHAILTGSLCAQINGFSLHAGVYCSPWQRDKLEKLCRYVARPAVAEERLTELPNGNIMYEMKKAYSDGTTHLLFSPIEFMEKLAALVPPPRIHLTRFHGVLAPHCKIRSQIVPKPEVKESPNESDKTENQGQSPESPEPTPDKKKRMKWAELLARVFLIDTKTCHECGGEMKIVAAILETEAIESILTHMKQPARPPPIESAKVPIQSRFEYE
jgi:hypothetical protein